MQPTNLIRLTDASIGRVWTVREFTDDRIASKLMAMGLLPGSPIELLRKAPWQGGVCIKSQKLKVAMRHNEASTILVE